MGTRTNSVINFIALAIFAPVCGWFAITLAITIAAPYSTCNDCPAMPKYTNSFQTDEDHEHEEGYGRKLSVHGGAIAFASNDDMEVVRDFYVDALKKEGWREGSGCCDFVKGPETAPDFYLKLDIYGGYKDSSLQEAITHVLVLMFRGECRAFYPLPPYDM